MGKKKTHRVGQALSEELGLVLSPFTLTLKHVVQLNAKRGGFLFVTTTQFDHHLYHRVEVVAECNGLPIKPAYFPIPKSVVGRLLQKSYAMWFFYDSDYLYPLQKVKPEALLETFVFRETENTPRENVILDSPEPEMWLRKKARLEMRESVPCWDSYLCPSKLGEVS